MTLVVHVMWRQRARLMYIGLLAQCVWIYGHSDHGVSERGWVPILECIPMLVLALQAIHPLRLIWWPLALVWMLWAALLLYT